MTEPRRIGTLPLALFNQCRADFTMKPLNPIFIVGDEVHAYLPADAAAALSFWEADADYVSTVVVNSLTKRIVRSTDASYMAGTGSGYDDGYAAGVIAGTDAGYASGYSDGDAAGQITGYAAGYPVGYTAGDAAGQITGYTAGYAVGFADGVASVPPNVFNRMSVTDSYPGTVMDGAGLLLDVQRVAGVRASFRAERAYKTGKRFCALTYVSHTGATQDINFGFGVAAATLAEFPGATPTAVGWDSDDGKIRNNGSIIDSRSPWTIGDEVGLLIDFDNSEFTCYLNGVADGIPISTGEIPGFIMVGPGYSTGLGVCVARMNFGGSPYMGGLPAGASNW